MRSTAQPGSSPPACLRGPPAPRPAAVRVAEHGGSGSGGERCHRYHQRERSPVTFNVQTAQGNFSFSSQDVPFGTSLTLLDGRALVAQTPSSLAVASSNEEEDYPAIAQSGDEYTWPISASSTGTGRARPPIPNADHGLQLPVAADRRRPGADDALFQIHACLDGTDCQHFHGRRCDAHGRGRGWPGPCGSSTPRGATEIRHVRALDGHGVPLPKCGSRRTQERTLRQ